MTTWNYRRIQNDAGCLGIHEVYMNEDGEITNWTTNAVDIWGEDNAELLRTYEMMKEAFDLPVLLESDLLDLVGEDGEIDNSDDWDDDDWDREDEEELDLADENEYIMEHRD